ncbi:hypothetical protein [Pyrobaculum aerophilum]|uniref:Uncharacterized protein n=2 Tax=Pyrobaculum aerophilum TaxID=13773 RepID=Q8ZYU3_PYRAE|nr:MULTISPECIES: hypothetical protein [Pyrobaculum]AAL62900.1 hypothetical protein PAE0620 [Pyrobaculum aerophilum str. IM2]MCX8135903.1 hypothetical protein [Pyrobaculum aerophilum]HII46035.1 hypothetical protein [Pyrobaculum aerophilum]
MEPLIFSLIALLTISTLLVRDNIYAAIILSIIDLVVAGGALLHLGALAFIITALVYIVASLTLVIIAASTISAREETVKLRPVAVASASLLALVSLGARSTAGGPQRTEFDF